MPMRIRHYLAGTDEPAEPTWTVVSETEFFYNVTLPWWEGWTVPVPKAAYRIVDDLEQGTSQNLT